MNALVKSADNLTVTSAGQDIQQYLTFMLGGEVFAIGILHIKEIIEYGQLTSVPMMPGFIRGVINLRGAVVPVVDLASRFGGKSSQVTRRSCIVILELSTDADMQVIGVVVDAVNEVLEIAGTDIEPPPTFGTRIRTDFIQGMGKVQERFVIILNVNRVLSVDEMAALGSVADNRAALVESAA
ncbi:chemotaxis protein CheW [Thiobacillus sp.]|uniref:chemotaxis protein CheW n=1 Tax=Thiobacillus sp. TaxID=924 RepID=UPI00181C93F1|nr:chemotaxis protein CheW [Thiobacillus sp.]MBC2731911.1 purine-binding chemotaxis protein CheW [Thiobacillus sp.]MBC2740649.1 purine-binding chemotaxis protein CheW [Thiobacillus sp.]MBC2758498.1 purine-binding chemotaxis protein CheW [Thiobacillus sp.]